MNICIFCQDSYMSGANKSLFDWISEDKIDNFIVILPHKNNNSEFYKLDNVKLYYGNYFCFHKDLAKRSLAFQLKKFLKRVFMKCFSKVIFNRISCFIKENNVDVIISNSFSIYYGALLAKTLGIKHVWHIREFMDLDHQIEHENKALISDLARYSSAIFISDVISDYYKNKYNFRNTTVIYNQINISNSINDKPFFENAPLKIIMCGTIQENKGQREAISAIKLLIDDGYDVVLDIFGDGPNYKDINTLINNERLEKYIHMMGYSNNLDEIRKQYDIALVCSSNEALGRVTIESMGSGTITIGADAGCTSKLITHGVNGLLYELHNPASLKEQIIYAMQNKEKMERIRINARKYAEDNFSRPIFHKVISYINQVEN